jgi:hypothetical protein
VPAAVSRFSNVRNITPIEGKNYGPRLLESVNAVAVDRSVHVYSAEYLKRLHWRYNPHFPLSPSEAAALASRSHYSGSSQADESAHVELNYDQVRAEVAKSHERVNFALTLLLIGSAVMLLGMVCALVLVFRVSSQYCRVYHLELTFGAFLKQHLAVKASVARRQYFKQQQETQGQLREQERLRLLRVAWEENLRSVLPNLADEQLRLKIRECLGAASPDLERTKALWMGIQEQAGQKKPAEKLSLLLESVRPYCTEEEFQVCQSEAFAILAKSGFKAARKFATTMHDEFRIRAREMEELERSGQNLA